MAPPRGRASHGSFMASNTVPGINSVDHALRLLSLLAAQAKALNVSDMARGLALPRPTIYRLLATLQAHRVVVPDGKGYRLGLGLVQLGEAARAHFDPGELARPMLEELVRQSGETAHFGVLDGDRICYLTKVDSPHSIRMLSSDGWRGPLHATGCGKVLLAYAEPALLDRIAAGPLEAYTARTCTTPEALRASVARIREQGYGEDNEELLEGLICIAAPVFAAGRIVGVTSVSGPPSRMAERERMRGLVLEAARRFSALLEGEAASAA